MSLHEEMVAMADKAVLASRELAKLTSRKKNNILEAMAEELDARRDQIKEENQKDMEAGKEAGLSQAMLDRLLLTDARIDGMIKGIRDVVVLKDPVGERISLWTRPNGLEIEKVHVPIGVIAIIFESRPNVTCDAAVLCFKTSNATILRGGKEAVYSNNAIAVALQVGGAKKGLPEGAIQLVQTTDRDAVRELVQMVGKIDLAIPRGGEGLIRAVTEQARIPVIKHYKGICSVYVDSEVDQSMASDVVINAKCQRPGVCNAIETLLVHKDVAEEFLPKIAKSLGERGVELRGDDAARAIVSSMTEAKDEDWDTEYLDLIIAVKVVDTIDDAILHINTHGSQHSDSIISSNEVNQKKFTKQVDSATVYINASTRFTDGGEFGMGAEIGVSTDKLHARGPMGLEELTTYKFIIHGTGQIR